MSVYFPLLPFEKNLEIITKELKANPVVIFKKEPICVKKEKKKSKTFSKSFCSKKEWKELRLEFLKTAQKICVYCGSMKELHVDHIKPKSKFKELAYEVSNLQILCKKCNFRKAATCK